MRLWESWVVFVRFGAIWDRFKDFLGICIGGCEGVTGPSVEFFIDSA